MPSLPLPSNPLPAPNQDEVRYTKPLPSFSLDDNAHHTESLKSASGQGLNFSRHPYCQYPLLLSGQTAFREKMLPYLQANLPITYQMTAYMVPST